MKWKEMFLIIGTLILLLGGLLVFGYWKVMNDIAKEGLQLGQIFRGPDLQIDTLIAEFKIKKKRWPKNFAELNNFNKEDAKYGRLHLECYKNLKFIETSQKALKVHFDSYNYEKTYEGPSDTELGP